MGTLQWMGLINPRLVMSVVLVLLFVACLFMVTLRILWKRSLSARTDSNMTAPSSQEPNATPEDGVVAAKTGPIDTVSRRTLH